MESISRISSLLESARELTLDASSAARGLRSSPRPLDNRQIKKLLDSRTEREVLDGLRRVTSMMYGGQKTLPFFSAVVKNVASPNLEIKKLVYIYVVHHAEQEPDMALLSINTIQKSLSDANPQVRALALRTMSGIRVPVISQIVSLAIKKGTGDMSPYVRRAAAMAIPKCYRLDPSQLPQLLEHLVVLLGDRQYYVAGAAVTAFMEVCPERLDLVHKNYRSLVKKIVDMDEWSQLATLRLMTVYARKCFPRRTKLVAVADTGAHGRSNGGTTTAASLSLGDFYEETQDANTDSESGGNGEKQEVVVLDADLVLLLDAIRPLLQSRNSGVVVAVARCYVSVGTAEYVKTAVGPLVALLRGPQDIQQIALYNIASVCLDHASDFVRYASHFLVRASDPPAVWELKIEVLALIFPHGPRAVKSLILHELEHFARGTNKTLVREAVRAIGRCAQADPDPSTAARCLRLLLSQITSLDGTLAAESLTVIRHLIQQDPPGHAATVVRLARNLDVATDPQARATIIWLVGEFSGLNGKDNIAADVLRILLKDFASEPEVAKRQIVLLGAKVYLHHVNREALARSSGSGEDKIKDENGNEHENKQHPIVRLWEYVQLLARYDTSYDLRDRTRLYRALLEVPQLATLMLLAPKPVPHAPSPAELRKGFTLGSAALVLGASDAGAGVGVYGLAGYEPLPGWVREGEEPDPRLRDSDDDLQQGQQYEYESRRGGSLRRPAAESLIKAVPGHRADALNGGSRGKVGRKTLDDWLAEDDKAGKGSVAEESSEGDDDDDDDEEEEEEESGEEESEEGGSEDDEEEDSEGEDEGSEEEESEDGEEDAPLVKAG